MDNQIINKVSCPKCGWMEYQTKSYGTASRICYICPNCDSHNLDYKPTSSRRERED